MIIALGARIKKSGEHMVSEPTELKVVHQEDGDEMDPYERLLGDAMEGDARCLAPGQRRGGLVDRRSDPRQRDAGPRVRAGELGAASTPIA